MQYSTIFTDEGTKVGGAVGAAEKTTDGEKRGGGRGGGVGKGETWTFTTAQYWYSDSVFLRSLPLNLLFPVFVPRLAPSHYFSHSLGGSYLTTVICISILLKKISNKVSRAAPSWGRPASLRLPLSFPANPSESVLQLIFREAMSWKHSHKF